MSNLSGAAPRTSKAGAAARAQLTADTSTFISGNFSTVAPGVPVCPCSFSSDPTHIAQSTTLFSGSTISTVQSEKMGEMGALHTLKAMLASQGKAFDPALLHEFKGANNFNMVYFDAKPPNATSAIILEAKGGSSTLGSRMDMNGHPVTQGTFGYADTIIAVMRKAPLKSPKGAERRMVAGQLKRIMLAQQAANPPTSKILYLGVATKYNKAKKLVHDPVVIFATGI